MKKLALIVIPFQSVLFSVSTIIGMIIFLFSYLPNLQSDNNVIQRQSLYLLERYYKDGFKADEIKSLEDTKKQVEEELKKVNKEIDEVGICPTCGQPIHNS